MLGFENRLPYVKQVCFSLCYAAPPPISAQTLTAIEMWLVACIGFLFLSLIELGLVMQAATLLDKDEKKKKKKKAKYSFMQTIFSRGREEEVRTRHLRMTYKLTSTYVSLRQQRYLVGLS